MLILIQNTKHKLATLALLICVALLGCSNPPPRHQPANAPLNYKQIAEVLYKIEEEHIYPVNLSETVANGMINFASNYDYPNVETIVEKQIVTLSINGKTKTFNTQPSTSQLKEIARAEPLLNEYDAPFLLPFYLGELIQDMVRFLKENLESETIIGSNVLQSAILDSALSSLNTQSRFFYSFDENKNYAATSPGKHIDTKHPNKLAPTPTSTHPNPELTGNIFYYQPNFYQTRIHELFFLNFTRKMGLNNDASFIFDLRGNQGGILKEVVQLLDLFLTESEIVNIHYRDNRRKSTLSTSNHVEFPSNKIVVLVDGATSSGAEIFAYAMKHFRQATIIGSNTAGNNNYIRSIQPLHNGNALLIAEGEFTIAQNHSYNTSGISANICIVTLAEDNTCPKTIYSGTPGSTQDIGYQLAIKTLRNIEN